MIFTNDLPHKSLACIFCNCCAPLLPLLTFPWVENNFSRSPTLLHWVHLGKGDDTNDWKISLKIWLPKNFSLKLAVNYNYLGTWSKNISFNHDNGKKKKSGPSMIYRRRFWNQPINVKLK